MKKIIYFLSLILVSNMLLAQGQCDCLTELDFVYHELQQAASFKSQIKGGKKAAFEDHYQRVRRNLSEAMPIEECFQKLHELKTFIIDEHLDIYQVRPDFSLEDIRDATFISEYRESLEFLNFPTFDGDLKQLMEELEQVPTESVEGIYTIGQELMKVGVFRSEDPTKLLGVILESKLGTWEPGHVYMYLTEIDASNRIYDITTYGQLHKNLIFMNNTWVKPNELLSNMRKDRVLTNYARYGGDKSMAYRLQTLDDDIQYIWFDSFNRVSSASKRDALIQQIESGLSASNLIIDLRDNTGGASKISVPIIKAIRKHGNPNIYVLTNYNSMSNAEQTTLRLLEDKRTVHLGERTRGVLAYGMNYGRTITSPSGLFKIMPTDMKFNKWLGYEEVGIQPKLKLNNESDWIEQTIDLINEGVL